jgi:hypothetical protein
MATTHHVDTRDDIAESVRARANGTSDAALVIGTSSLALPSTGVLAIIPIPNFGAVSSGAITSATTDLEGVVLSPGGTAAIGIVVHENPPVDAASEVFRGAVGVGSGEIQVTSTTLAEGDIIRITNDLTYTAPP